MKTRLTYNIVNGVTAGFTYSYDDAFKSVATGDIKWRFGSKSYGSPREQEAPAMPVIQALSATPANRDVRVHDGCYKDAAITNSQAVRDASVFVCPFHPIAVGRVANAVIGDSGED